MARAGARLTCRVVPWLWLRAAGAKGEKRELGLEVGGGRRPLDLSSEPFGPGEIGTRAREGNGETTAGGFVLAAGLRTMHKKEGETGVRGMRGCLGCYWVGKVGNLRTPLLAA